MPTWSVGGGVLYDTAADELHVAPIRRDIPISDRTGGGDSFASGVLAALLKGKDLDTAVQWGAAQAMANLREVEQLHRLLHTNVQEALALEVCLLKLQL